MGRWFRCLIVLVGVVALGGCGGGGERNKNKDLDRPKPTEKAS